MVTGTTVFIGGTRASPTSRASGACGLAARDGGKQMAAAELHKLLILIPGISGFLFGKKTILGMADFFMGL